MMGDTSPDRTHAAPLQERMRDFFSDTGPLSDSRDFEFRPEQQQMAMEVARSLQQADALVIEAGTGVGKSLAYLVPSVTFALETKQKAVISTHTINLQEQLIEKDLPLLQKLIPNGFKAVLMKGRHNYICPRRLARAIANGPELFTSTDQVELMQINEWMRDTTDGSLSDLDFTPQPRVWAQVCSEPSVCTLRTCGPDSGCFYQKVRRQVAEADVVVLNHTLLFTLLASQDDVGQDDEKGFLFPRDFVVIDEAHTLEHVAARQLGLRLSQAGMRFDLNRLYNPRSKKGIFHMLRSGGGVRDTIDLIDGLDDFFSTVASHSKFGPYSNVFRVRNPDLVDNTLHARFLAVEKQAKDAAENIKNENQRAEVLDLAGRIREMRQGVADYLDQALEDHVYWVEKSGGEGNFLTLQSAPVNVAEHIRRIFFHGRNACILTSATLGTSEGSDDLSYFRKRVGAESVRSIQIGSPFDYEQQMRIFLVKSMPDPGTDKFEAALEKWIAHFIQKSSGRAFVLFTSYRLMRSLADKMEKFFKDEGYQLLVQGNKMPRHQLIQEFRSDISSVLFGTDSFWTGVDVPGEALSNVIVTRLPFAVPDHPLVASRLERIEEEGGNPFMEYSVPEAILKLRQGVGRLIRSKRDRGITVILDNRVLTKMYGKAFLRSLPPAPVQIIE
jgi:ATP-dependent DNA helicase DinG